MATKVMTFTSKGILNSLDIALDAAQDVSFPNAIGLMVDSNEETEYYTHFGAVPQMTIRGEGGRNAKRPKLYDWSIKNEKYSASIDIPLDWLRRDKTSKVQQRINELALTPYDHWQALTTTLLEAGPSTVCYDGQYFFDTDHAESGSNQSNDIEVDIDTLPIPTDRQGTVTAPGVETMRYAIFAGIKQLYSLTDDQGRPMNQGVTRFAVHVPLGLWDAAGQALGATLIGAGNTNTLASMQVGNRTVMLELYPNPRSAWTDEFSVHVIGGQGLILQEETPPTPIAKAEGSDFEFDNDAWQFAMDSTRAAGYGRWQHACLVTLV